MWSLGKPTRHRISIRCLHKNNFSLCLISPNSLGPLLPHQPSRHPQLSPAGWGHLSITNRPRASMSLKLASNAVFWQHWKLWSCRRKQKIHPMTLYVPATCILRNMNKDIIKKRDNKKAAQTAFIASTFGSSPVLPFPWRFHQHLGMYLTKLIWLILVISIFLPAYFPAR